MLRLVLKEELNITQKGEFRKFFHAKIKHQSSQLIGNFVCRPPKIPQVLEDAVVLEIARAHSKSAAQILLRAAIQLGIAVIPKSVKPDRIKENFDVVLRQIVLKKFLTTFIPTLF